MLAREVLVGLTGGSSNLQVNGTLAGSYTFYVTTNGTGSGVVQSKPVTLTVQ